MTSLMALFLNGATTFPPESRWSLGADGLLSDIVKYEAPTEMTPPDTKQVT